MRRHRFIPTHCMNTDRFWESAALFFPKTQVDEGRIYTYIRNLPPNIQANRSFSARPYICPPLVIFHSRVSKPLV